MDEAVVIDGILDEAIWSKTTIATDFSQFEPYNLSPARYGTEVRVLYNDIGLYVGATIFDPHPDSISLELRSRDDDGLADFFGVVIDPFCDGLNGFGFAVTARGVQIDFKSGADNEDDVGWDAVWKSKTSLNDDGWIAELFIPYAAIRFVKKDIQTWRINFWRSVQRYREYDTWSPVDIKVASELAQSGELIGLKNLKPPLRLSATPYVSASGNYYSGDHSFGSNYNFGLDLKAGLSESFTLDLTLIPDFGQVESDKKIYSLSPFEVYYEEKRPFFTEGTELFSKGDVFYSRRVGASPGKYNEIENNYLPEDIIENPESAQLINAFKLSGKTKSGLGIGVFNAMNSNTYARVIDSNQVEKQILTGPYTNFNMFILDQAFKNNSYVSFYNTNVYKPENQYAANVTGSEFRLRNNSNNYEIGGLLNVSQHYSALNKPRYGEKATVRLAKVSGIIQAVTWLNMVSENYNPNDMGFQQRTNEFENGLSISHNIFEPRGSIVKWYTNLELTQLYQHIPRKFALFEIAATTRGTFKNQLTIGGDAGMSPLGYYDFYEPRVNGRYYFESPAYSFNVWTSPDYSKTFIIDDYIGFWHSLGKKQFTYWIGMDPRWRIKDNFLLIPGIRYEFQNNSIGYVTDSINSINQTEEIIFGRRDIKTITSTLSADYIFTKDISLSVKMRHYWLNVTYLSYYDLLEDGSLKSNHYDKMNDFSINYFNLDLVFQWNFAPGSELLVIWKNAIYNEKEGSPKGVSYLENIQNMYDSPINNSLTIKALYYLDWQYFKRNRKGQSKAISSDVRNHQEYNSAYSHKPTKQIGLPARYR
ncbi:MAG: carbohydrate binding family 9 domain-containing protein [Bacteroidales bacterium]|nr:carbohydrate binding family 9 domain-containing protein [Bacteroidales bacterium]